MKIFYDVDTQHDFMDKGGALYVPGAEEIKPNLKRLTDYADKKRIPIIGSVDVHFGTEEYKDREGEMKKWGGPFPDHCIAGSMGSDKIDETSRFTSEYHSHAPLVELERYIPNNLDAKIDAISFENSVSNIKEHTLDSHFFEKQSYDVFTNPNFEVFLQAVDIKEAVVYGVATDYCVKAAVIGMQQRGIQCYVVEDAIAAVTPKTGKSALEEMVKSGAKLIKTEDVLKNKMRWKEISKKEHFHEILVEWMKKNPKKR